MKNIYVCGPTVYAKAHIGNMRPIITFDIVRRALLYQGEKVNFIHNITDIDDKIIKKAQEQKITEQEVAKKNQIHYLKLLKKTNVLQPTYLPTVLKNIKNIVGYIQNLIQKNFAYESNGNIFFDIKSIKTYGHISNRNLESMQYEDDNKNKRHPADFALWKKTQEGIQFPSPWGDGRPGWHTECAFFVKKYLPKNHTLDIHGGGIDLLFPHHENEDVQAFATTNKHITKEWRHTGHINLDGQKMSKSLNNIFDAQNFINIYGDDSLRILFLSSSYSAPIDLNDNLIKQTSELFRKFKHAFLKAQTIINKNNSNYKSVKIIAQFLGNFKFSQVMKKINLIIKDFNKQLSPQLANEIIAIMKLIGFNFSKITISKEDKQKLFIWNNLRKNKKFSEADILRKELIKKELI